MFALGIRLPFCEEDQKRNAYMERRLAFSSSGSNQHHPPDMWVNKSSDCLNPQPLRSQTLWSRDESWPLCLIWLTKYMSITNGCFTPLSFSIIYYTAMVSSFAMCQNSLPCMFPVRVETREILLGVSEGRNEAAAICIWHALLLICWFFGLRQLQGLHLLFWTSVFSSVMKGQTSSGHHCH